MILGFALKVILRNPNEIGMTKNLISEEIS